MNQENRPLLGELPDVKFHGLRRNKAQDMKTNTNMQSILEEDIVFEVNRFFKAIQNAYNIEI